MATCLEKIWKNTKGQGVNSQIKILNDVLVETARLLDKVFSAEDPFLFIEENTAEIHMTLQEASETLAGVPVDTRGNNTWEYDDGSEKCVGDSCHR